MTPKFVGLALATLILGACAAPAVKPAAQIAATEPGSRDPAGPPPPTPAEQADCTLRGGQMQRVGMLAAFACVIPFGDAGKACANDADCGGDCWISGVPAGPNTKARGQCQPTNMPFGCHASLDKGVVSPELCAD